MVNKDIIHVLIHNHFLDLAIFVLLCLVAEAESLPHAAATMQVQPAGLVFQAPVRFDGSLFGIGRRGFTFFQGSRMEHFFSGEQLFIDFLG